MILDSSTKMMIPTQIPISPLTLSLISGIHELKGALRTASHMAPDRMLALRQVATLESVASGLRLGNVVLSDIEVRRVLARHTAENSHADRPAETAGNGMRAPDSGQHSPATGQVLPPGWNALDDLLAEPLADRRGGLWRQIGDWPAWICFAFSSWAMFHQWKKEKRT